MFMQFTAASKFEYGKEFWSFCHFYTKIWICCLQSVSKEVLTSRFMPIMLSVNINWNEMLLCKTRYRDMSENTCLCLWNLKSDFDGSFSKKSSLIALPNKLQISMLTVQNLIVPNTSLIWLDHITFSYLLTFKILVLVFRTGLGVWDIS